MILFFDVFILDDNNTLGNFTNKNLSVKSRRTILENQARSNHAYRHRSKLEITKYTLASYSILHWEKVIIRYEIENGKRSLDFESYCKNLFPFCIIENNRSNTAKKYYETITKYCDDTKFVFFSPNNDHVFMSPKEFPQKLLTVADKLSRVYTNSSVSIVYSHFMEEINSISHQNMLWGTNSGVTHKKIYEDEICFGVKTNKFIGDSHFITKAKDLKEIFSKAPNRGRVVRIEDTGFNLSRQFEQILIIPKEEICRHYDSAFFRPRTGEKKDPWLQQPLFIPDGFFEKNIRIRYGYNNRQDGFVSINPLFNSICTSNPAYPELNILLQDIPLFWKKRISNIDINAETGSTFDNLIKENLSYYKYNKNPWADHSRFEVFILIIVRDISLMFYRLLVEPLWPLRVCLKNMFCRTYFYKIIKKLITNKKKPQSH